MTVPVVGLDGLEAFLLMSGDYDLRTAKEMASTRCSTKPAAEESW